MPFAIFENKIDSTIRFFLYVLIFWLPYSPAVVESCVIICILLWVIKRGMIAGRQKNLTSGFLGRLFRFIKCFKSPSSPINKPISFFLIVCSLSVLGSVSFSQSWHNFLTKTLEWFVIYFLVIEVFKEKRHIFTVIAVLLFTSLATSLDGIVQFHITQKDIFLGHVIEVGGRATAGFKAPNSLGAYLSLIIPLVTSVFLLNRKNIKYKYVLLLILFLAIWSLIVTFSRGAWLGTFLGGIFFLLVLIFHNQQRKFYVILGLLIVTTIGCSYLGFIYTSSLDLESLFRHTTMQWREGIWQDSFTMIADRPFFGHGINTFMRYFEYYRSDYGMDPTYAHNCYIQLTAETGILGLFSFLWIIGRLFRETIGRMESLAKRDRQLMILSAGLLSGIFAFLCHSFVDANFYSLQLSVYLWFMIGMLVAICNIPKSVGDVDSPA